MAFTLPALPYAKDALAPHISAETLDFHHGKHHNAYVNNLNTFLGGTEFENWSIEDLVTRNAELPAEKRKAVFNNAAQCFNHDFYWKCLGPAGSAPSGKLLAEIEATWGSVADFKAAFTKEAIGHFGSGWAWLVRDADGKLKITSTHDADSPIAHGQTPLLTCDVWEHAYYVDYRNLRAKYVEAFWNVVNWDFVASCS